MRHAVLAGLMLVALGTAFASEPAQRQLTFEDRVKAQEGIERVYYAHQIGATKSFEAAVPRAALESKVHKYLEQTAALKVYWKTAVTDEMLQRELERIVAGTRMPERLLEVYAALDSDPFLIKECLARATLVDRLTRNFYAFDPTIHAETRRRAEDLARQLSSGELSPTTDHPNRSEVELVLSEATAETPRPDVLSNLNRNGTMPFRRALSPTQFRKERERFPDAVGRVPTPKEERDAFVLSVVLSETTRDVRAAHYVIPKTRWDAWWSSSKAALRSEQISPVASSHNLLPAPTTDLSVGGAADRLSANGLPCAADDTWDNGTLDDLPNPRHGHTAVWTGSLMVVWGGSAGLNGSRYDPATDSWTPMSSVGAPSGSGSSVWTGTEMILWGSYPYNVNTGGRYNPLTDSWKPTAIVDAPSARYGHTAVWTGSEMVVWGGSDYSYSMLDTGGRYDPVADKWTPTSTTGAPSPRFPNTAVWTGSQMLICGGYDGTYLNNGGRYDPGSDSWTPMSSTGAPSSRYAPTAVWTGSVMVLWGGLDPDSRHGLNTGGRYDPATDSWAPTSTTDAPEGRFAPTSVWTGSLVVVWGGKNDYQGEVWLNSGGRYDPATDSWTLTSGGGPSARYIHTAVWTGSLMVVWGGYNGESDLNTGGRYDPATNSWTPTSTAAAPAARDAHTAVWTGSVMVVWGGYGGYYEGGLLGTGGRYDPATDTWTPTSTTDAPSARSGHTAVWTGSLMVVWGGRYDGLDTGGRYDPINDSWTPTSTDGAPSGRYQHTAVWTGSLMVVWGGSRYPDDFNTGGRYDPESDSWTPTSTVGAPSARSQHSAVWTGSLMLVWGGTHPDPYSYLDTGGRYDPATDGWTPMTTTDAPSARKAHPAVWTGNVMVVWGGFGGYSSLDTGGRYDPATDGWTPISMTDAPSARYSHTAVWTGTRMVVWGGAGYSSLDTGGRYDPTTDGWKPTTAVGAPSVRYGHTAVWTGSLMLVWGGFDDYNLSYVNTGGRYILGATVDNDGDGYSECQGDCNDTDATVYPGAPQLCDGKNDNCSNPAWPAVPANEADADRDGYRICSGDCNDTDAAVYPGALELCDGKNNNCSDPSWPVVPANEADADHDGFRICGGDCDDTRVSVYPGAPESCDRVDNNCNGQVDENAAGVDSDGDGIHNACDNCQFVANPTQIDGDGDHVGNACDNCITIPNPNQSDVDTDGRGEACDNCPTVPNGFQDDFDGDRVGDACDNCVFDFNPSKSDFDHDGEGDVCDLDDGLIYVLGTDDRNYREWQAESGYTTWNSYRGSLAVFRATGQYTQTPGSNLLAVRDCGLNDPWVFDDVVPVPGDVAFNLVTGVAGGVESSLGTNSAGVPRANANPCP